MDESVVAKETRERHLQDTPEVSLSTSVTEEPKVNTLGNTSEEDTEVPKVYLDLSSMSSSEG